MTEVEAVRGAVEAMLLEVVTQAEVRGDWEMRAWWQARWVGLAMLADCQLTHATVGEFVSLATAGRMEYLQ